MINPIFDGLLYNTRRNHVYRHFQGALERLLKISAKNGRGRGHLFVERALYRLVERGAS